MWKGLKTVAERKNPSCSLGGSLRFPPERNVPSTAHVRAERPVPSTAHVRFSSWVPASHPPGPHCPLTASTFHLSLFPDAKRGEEAGANWADASLYATEPGLHGTDPVPKVLMQGKTGHGLWTHPSQSGALGHSLESWGPQGVLG